MRSRHLYSPIPVAAQSKAWVYGRSPAGIVGSNPTGAWMFVCSECCVLSGRGLCDELITLPDETYRLRCVVVCDLEAWRTRRPWSALGRSAIGKKIYFHSSNTVSIMFQFQFPWSIFYLPEQLWRASKHDTFQFFIFCPQCESIHANNLRTKYALFYFIFVII
jgi:hypothetical protein